MRNPVKTKRSTEIHDPSSRRTGASQDWCWPGDDLAAVFRANSEQTAIILPRIVLKFKLKGNILDW